MKTPLILMITFYKRYVSALFPAACRFYPSCSEYAIEAIEKKGIMKGVFLVFRRILRCNPFSPGGYDPVD